MNCIFASIHQESSPISEEHAGSTSLHTAVPPAWTRHFYVSINGPGGFAPPLSALPRSPPPSRPLHVRSSPHAPTMSVAALFSALSPDERRFMLAPPGAVEPGLSPAALAAAAVWTTRETGSVATLEALCPGGAFIPSPGDLPGEACNIDMSHLVCIWEGRRGWGGVGGVWASGGGAGRPSRVGCRALPSLVLGPR